MSFEFQSVGRITKTKNGEWNWYKTQKGGTILNLTIAANENYYKMIAFDKVANRIMKYLNMGDQVIFKGSVSITKSKYYTSQDGYECPLPTFIINNIIFLPNQKESMENSQDQTQQTNSQETNKEGLDFFEMEGGE